jgi:MFS transporter, ACS family, allantoate permease
MSGAAEPKMPIEAVVPLTVAPVAVKAIKTGKANEVDIAAQILADYADTMGPEGWTKEEEKKLMRKVDWWLIPIVSVPFQ